MYSYALQVSRVLDSSALHGLPKSCRLRRQNWVG
jgi:hypothetical protein